jgi:hypothetical protein
MDETCSDGWFSKRYIEHGKSIQENPIETLVTSLEVNNLKSKKK